MTIEERSAALVLRVWPEGEELRCRVIRVTDALAPHSVVAQGEDAICAEVRRWLREFQRPG
jgi:hypothetical protein